MSPLRRIVLVFLVLTGLAIGAGSAGAAGNVFVVTNVADSGAGSLRDAIERSNASAPVPLVANGISFQLGSGAPGVIRPATALPVLTNAVVLDGTSGSGRVTLDGSALPAGSALLVVDVGSASGGDAITSQLQTLILTRAPGEGIRHSHGRLLVKGCEITAGGIGILLNGTSAAQIGSPATGPGTNGATIPPPAGPANGGNVIAGNASAQIRVVGGGAHVIRGNFIGTSADGRSAVASAAAQGIGLDGASGVTIGGLLPGQGNLIAGQGGAGIRLNSADGTAGRHLVSGNYVGVDLSGASPLANGTGILVSNSPGNVIENNVVSGNLGAGVSIEGANATATQVAGNYLGVDASALIPVGNALASVRVKGATGSVIGGTIPGFGNVIGGAQGGSPGIDLEGADGTVVRGNFIGTDLEGTRNLANSGSGVRLLNTSGATLGGSAPGGGNLVAFNGDRGIAISTSGGGAAVNNRISGNRILTHPTLAIDLGADGRTANDAGDADDGPNHLQNFPVLATVVTTSGGTTITGTMAGAPNATLALEFFASVGGSAANPAAEAFLGGVSVTTDAGGAAAISFSAGTLVPAGRLITATATDAAGNTSELSAPLMVTGVAAGPDLELSIDEANTDRANLRYGFTVRNRGPGDASGAVVQISLPAETKYFYGFALSGVLSGSNGTATYQVPALPAGQSVSFAVGAYFIVTPPPTGPRPAAKVAVEADAPAGVMEATLTTAAPDPNPANNSVRTGVALVRQVVNLSSRDPIGTVDNVLIGGLIISGTGTKRVALVARGPSLFANGAPVPGTLQNPVIEVHDQTGALIPGSGVARWQDGPTPAELGASGFAPVDPRESGIVLNLAPGGYTVIVRGANGATGIGTIEIYDLEPENTRAKLANIATRGQVLTGDSVLIAGFVVQGTQPQRLLIRAKGPSLNVAGVPVPGRLSNPVLSIYTSQGSLSRLNDDWRAGAQAAEILATGLQPEDDREACLVDYFVPGAYTAIVTGSGGATGVALIEVFVIGDR